MTKSTAIELIAADDYTRFDFQADLRELQRAAQARESLVRQVQTFDRTNTIDLARRVLRMRESDHWCGPGMKDNDREFYGYLIREGIEGAGWGNQLLMAGRVLAVFDQLEADGKLSRDNFPVGASQVKSLGSRWYLNRPRELANVWLAAVDEAPSGQPSKELVATKARRYKADVQSTEKANALPFEARRVHRRLAKIRRQLIDLYREDAVAVETFLRELAVSIRDEARS